MAEFDAGVRQIPGAGGRTRPWPYVAEPKIDGLSLSLRYEAGVWCRPRPGATAETAEDVTANARTIDDHPAAT